MMFLCKCNRDGSGTTVALNGGDTVVRVFRLGSVNITSRRVQIISNHYFITDMIEFTSTVKIEKNGTRSSDYNIIIIIIVIIQSFVDPIVFCRVEQRVNIFSWPTIIIAFKKHDGIK